MLFNYLGLPLRHEYEIQKMAARKGRSAYLDYTSMEAMQTNVDAYIKATCLYQLEIKIVTSLLRVDPRSFFLYWWKTTGNLKCFLSLYGLNFLLRTQNFIKSSKFVYIL